MCFEVHDTGICISSEQQIRLFSSFSQADTSTTRLYESTALGLAWLGLAWLGLAWLGKMSGRIVIESQRGVGSTLWFEIPLLKAARELNLDTNIGPTCTAALLRLTPKATRVTTSGSTQHGCSFY
ncbi:ATP-binding protein [Xylella fastidiosa]|uniref:ATP-binding protein n=1 Tax=Xylella fastidiosa TaxID=2371 RepID=UPI0021CCC754|nr:ATP-binding protein [Xylella fastidiosa]MDD0928549.1 hypothetical protein [Xylella fastidiosa subsp. multiplex]